MYNCIVLEKHILRHRPIQKHQPQQGVPRKARAGGQPLATTFSRIITQNYQCSQSKASYADQGVFKITSLVCGGHSRAEETGTRDNGRLRTPRGSLCDGYWREEPATKKAADIIMDVGVLSRATLERVPAFYRAPRVRGLYSGGRQKCVHIPMINPVDSA